MNDEGAAVAAVEDAERQVRAAREALVGAVESGWPVWVDQFVSELVRDQASVTTGLTSEALSSLKAEIARVKVDGSQAVRAIFGSPTSPDSLLAADTFVIYGQVDVPLHLKSNLAQALFDTLLAAGYNMNRWDDRWNVPGTFKPDDVAIPLGAADTDLAAAVRRLGNARHDLADLRRQAREDEAGLLWEQA